MKTNTVRETEAAAAPGRLAEAVAAARDERAALIVTAKALLGWLRAFGTSRGGETLGPIASDIEAAEGVIARAEAARGLRRIGGGAE